MASWGYGPPSPPGTIFYSKGSEIWISVLPRHSHLTLLRLQILHTTSLPQTDVDGRFHCTSSGAKERRILDFTSIHRERKEKNIVKFSHFIITTVFPIIRGKWLKNVIQLEKSAICPQAPSHCSCMCSQTWCLLSCPAKNMKSANAFTSESWREQTMDGSWGHEGWHPILTSLGFSFLLLLGSDNPLSPFSESNRGQDFSLTTTDLWTTPSV